jgi:hypothetical protein
MFNPQSGIPSVSSYLQRAGGETRLIVGAAGVGKDRNLYMLEYVKRMTSVVEAYRDAQKIVPLRVDGTTDSADSVHYGV